MSLLVSISGVRGIVGESLTPEVAVRYASAFAEYAGGGRIVLGRDGRVTGGPLANIISSTLVSMGCDVIALGIVPTPTVGLTVEKMRAAGGISVTASHNPMQWNGMKFIGQSGMFLDGVEIVRLQRILAGPPPRYAPWDKTGRHTRDESAIGRHIDAVLSQPLVRPDAIRKRSFTVVADCINAAGGAVIPELLRRLGCRVIGMNDEVGGIFSHDPEPIPGNLTALCAAVKQHRADLGIAVDPDVDRLVFITEKGEPFGEEYTVATAVNYVLGAGPRGGSPVVVNLSTTRAVDDIAARYGAPVHRTPVGEINVAGRMKTLGAAIGGEGSGGVIFPALHYMRDAMAGIGLILSQIAEAGGTMSEFRASLPSYTIRKTSIRADGKDTAAMLDAVAERLSPTARCNMEDGVKFDFDDGWVHLRRSNTEPIVRIIAEARTPEAADALLARFRNELG
ncbi:MAG TPA: phosphoglucosamine mutase [Bacteroidota bacterium]|nr:phosphoglucosamine mutase [Bacteroidota bacterium]